MTKYYFKMENIPWNFDIKHIIKKYSTTISKKNIHIIHFLIITNYFSYYINIRRHIMLNKTDHTAFTVTTLPRLLKFNRYSII